MSRNTRAKLWSKQVIDRDKKCLKCGSTNRLHAHHIYSWKEYENLRYEISNGMTLCCSCHLSLEKKGMPSHMRGKKHKPETIEKLKIAKIGYIPWNKGIRNIPESKICKICKIIKNKEDFTPTKFWYSNTCKKCRNLKLKAKRCLISNYQQTHLQQLNGLFPQQHQMARIQR